MKLYHGSNTRVENPILSAGRRALDFGCGFYLTSDYAQAVRWAHAVVRRRSIGEPIVNIYELDESQLAALSVLKFEEPTAAWLEFVVQNRKSLNPVATYDLIIGPVANDSTLPVIDDYMDGRYTQEEAIRRLLPQKLTDQFACVTSKALALLQFKKSEVLNEG